jgi:hypothetical protein
MHQRDFEIFEGLTMDQLSEPSIAIETLGHLLARGAVLPFLGAGASVGLGMPTWSELVRQVGDRVGTDKETLDEIAAMDVLSAMDALRHLSGEAFLANVKDVLYDSIPPNYGGTTDLAFAQNPLLHALGALVISSSKGGASEVITLNFDDALEWYLHLHGLVPHIVHSPPTFASSRCDVTIYHPHGFLPLAEDTFEGGDSIVVSRRDFIERLSADSSAPWSSIFLSGTYSKVLLVIGSSMSDFDIDVQLTQVQKQAPERPVGFCVSASFSALQHKDLVDRGLVPVALDDFKYLPNFLLAICRRSAQVAMGV